MIESAQIHWRYDDGGRTVPVATDFDDVYFSVANGLDESRYVFLQGNDLPARLACVDSDFVIVEIGFGTGLNFLATCDLWRQTASSRRSSRAHLHYVGLEKHPLQREDLAQALAVWTAADERLSTVADALLAQYPVAVAGCHRLHFDHVDAVGRLTLDLWFGDACDSLAQMQTKVDAWYLDGFAPAKNSELWSAKLFDQIARLSYQGAHQEGGAGSVTSLATFSAAGAVRRELLRIHATPKKIKGYGKKREMLTAVFERAWEDASCQTVTTTHATIIGAGVAGLCTAYALARRGVQVSLLDQDKPLAGASGNLRALISPKLTAAVTLDAVRDNLSLAGFLYACRFYAHLNQPNDTVYEATGVVDFLQPSNKSFAKLSALVEAYPDTLICDDLGAVCDDADMQADFDRHTIAAWLPSGGLIDPLALARAVLAHPQIDYRQQAVDDLYDLMNQLKPSKTHAVIICAGFQSHELHPALFNCRKIRGQVTYLNVADTTALRAPIKYDGYAAMSGDQLILGASFVRNCTDRQISADEHRQNLAKFCQALPNLAKVLGVDRVLAEFAPPLPSVQGRASIRAQTPDYHPMVGHLGDQVYVLSALGSKGFSLAPLCAELLASIICPAQDAPLPVSTSLLAKLSPHRERLQTPLEHQS